MSKRRKPRRTRGQFSIVPSAGEPLTERFITTLLPPFAPGSSAAVAFVSVLLCTILPMTEGPGRMEWKETARHIRYKRTPPHSHDNALAVRREGKQSSPQGKAAVTDSQKQANPLPLSARQVERT